MGFDEVQIGWVTYRYIKVMDLMELLNVEPENNESNFRSLFRALLLVINSSVLDPCTLNVPYFIQLSSGQSTTCPPTFYWLDLFIRCV